LASNKFFVWFKGSTYYFRETKCGFAALHKQFDRMKETEKNVFQRTPFGHFLSFPHVTTDNEILGWFVEHFDANEVGLRIATGVVPFTVEDVALLLGLRVHGQRVDMDAMYVEKRDGVNLDNTQLLGHLTATSKMGEEEEHVRLLISMIFNHFLFFDGSLRTKAWYTKLKRGTRNTLRTSSGSIDMRGQMRFTLSWLKAWSKPNGTSRGGDRQRTSL